MFIRRLRSSHNCYFPPPPTTLAATKQARLPPDMEHGKSVKLGVALLQSAIKESTKTNGP